MNLLTEKEKVCIENRLENDTDKVFKERVIEEYAFYQCCLMGIEKVLPDLKKYGLV